MTTASVPNKKGRPWPGWPGRHSVLMERHDGGLVCRCCGAFIMGRSWPLEPCNWCLRFGHGGQDEVAR